MGALEYRVGRGRRQGVAHVTVTAYAAGGGRVGRARLTDAGRTLDDLWVEPALRGNGFGSALLDEVIRLYGRNVLRVQVAPYRRGRRDPGGLDRFGLGVFYARRGFRPDAAGIMVRQPAAGP